MDFLQTGPGHDAATDEAPRPDQRAAAWIGVGAVAVLLAIAGLGYNALSQSRAANQRIADADRQLASLADAFDHPALRSPDLAEDAAPAGAGPSPVPAAPASKPPQIIANLTPAPKPTPAKPADATKPGVHEPLPEAREAAAPAATDAKAAADTEAIERFNAVSDDIQRRGRAIRDEYERTLTGLRLGERLVPELLVSREEIAESRRRVTEARRALHTLIADRAALEEEAPDLLSDAAPDASTSTIAVTEFYQTMLRISPALERHDAYHGAVFDSMDAILDISERALGRSRVVDGVLLLPSDADAVAFRLESSRINELSRRTTAVLQRLAAFAQTTSDAFDRGVEPPADPVMPWQTGDAITITRRGLRFQHQDRATIDLGVPDTLAPLTDAFGQPDRQERDGEQHLHYWDELGLVARTTDGTQLVWLAVTTNTFDHDGAFLPGHEFRGRLRVFGEPFGETDTPASLNRIVGEEIFRPLTEDGSLWGAQGGGFTVCVPLSETGLAYGVMLQPERDNPGPVKPRF